MISQNAVQCIFSHFYLECFVRFTPCFCLCFRSRAPLIIAMAVTFISHILAFYWIWFTVWIFMRFHFMQKYSLISPPISNETILTRRRLQKRVRDRLTMLEFVASGENDYYYLLMACRCPCRRHLFVWMQFLIEIPWVHSSVTNRFVRCGVLCFRCLHLRLYARQFDIRVFFHFFYVVFSVSPFD